MKMRLVGERQTRVVMASLALLCLVAQASTLVHLVLVPHQACAEHGELIDARADGVPVPLARIHHALGSAAAVGRAAAPRAHSHDHCAVLATRRDGARASQPSLALDHRAAEELPSPALCVSRPASIRLLDVAPKSSPPA